MDSNRLTDATDSNDRDNNNNHREDADLHSTASEMSDPHAHQRHNGKNGAAATEEIIIARAETRCVLYLRFITFGFLLVATIVVSQSIRSLMRQAETKALQVKFNDTARKVQEAVGTILENILLDVDAFAVTMTSHATSLQEATNGSNYQNSADSASSSAPWPFVTIPNIAVRGSKLRSLSKIFLFSIYHYIEHADRDAWENYTRTHDGWVNEGIQTQRTDPTFRGTIVDDWTTLGQINYYGQRAADAEFYIARWQSTPIVPIWDPYNWNAFQEPLIRDAMMPVLKNREVVISTSYNVDESFMVPLEEFVGSAGRAAQPAVEIYSPVLNDRNSGMVTFEDRKDSPLVAIIGLSIFWRDLIEGILPYGNMGLVAVFSNECNQTFTFQIDGPDATYLGAGDRHDTAFDHFMTESSLRDLTRYSAFHTIYTGPELNTEFCPYKLQLYSSMDMAEDYITPKPTLFAWISVGIFVFTSIVFLTYDHVIERRQRTVMKTATRSSAIVHSLFPSTIRTRLYDTTRAPTHALPLPNGGDADAANPQGRMKKFLLRRQQQTAMLVDTNNADDGVGVDDPIADSFESTTVLFADIKGFTKWSSTREPHHVFILLETLYGAYDALAEKWGVYKIETIGDSYVAVSGLPEKREDHAVAMAKFAIDIRKKTNDLVRELAVSLGDDTKYLTMRIGMHSGSVTAGVLRGQRARFQLFGDTVNTASRMESNGEGNMIQVSQATADLLEQAGKKAWLNRREDLIVAKGKGSMQTYWLDPSNRPETSPFTTLSI